MKLTEHVHALKIPFHILTPQGKVARFVYVYLIYGKEICLIDSGVAGSEQIIFDYLKKTGRSTDEITLLILTHSHPDHIGAAAAIKKESGSKVAAHEAEKDWIEDIDLQARERPVPGFHELVGGSVKVDHILADGDSLNLGDDLNLKILHTPGHSSGSLSLWLAHDGALFSADAIPLAGDIPIFDDIVASVNSIRKLWAIEGIKFLLAAWDQPREEEKAYKTMDEGLQYLNCIHEAVRKFADRDPSPDPIELGRMVLDSLGLPGSLANPLVARSFQSSLRILNSKSPFLS